jgi:hypothetical protein
LATGTIDHSVSWISSPLGSSLLSGAVGASGAGWLFRGWMMVLLMSWKYRYKTPNPCSASSQVIACADLGESALGAIAIEIPKHTDKEILVSFFMMFRSTMASEFIVGGTEINPLIDLRTVLF